jgi:hypothetical protein
MTTSPPTLMFATVFPDSNVTTAWLASASGVGAG